MSARTRFSEQVQWDIHQDIQKDLHIKVENLLDWNLMHLNRMLKNIRNVYISI